MRKLSFGDSIIWVSFVLWVCFIEVLFKDLRFHLIMWVRASNGKGSWLLGQLRAGKKGCLESGGNCFLSLERVFLSKLGIDEQYFS